MIRADQIDMEDVSSCLDVVKKIRVNGNAVEKDNECCVDIVIPRVELVQESGDSEIEIMSQKAVTEYVAKYVEDTLKMASLPDLIKSFTASKSVFEKGTNASFELRWTLSRDPISIKINDIIIEDLNAIDYQVLSLSDNKTYTLEVSDSFGTSKKSLTINFYNPIYYGVSGDVISSYDLLTKLVQGTRKCSFTVTAGENEYIYYALPSSYGEPVFSSGGFVGGFNYIRDITLNNVSYKLYRSTMSNLGTTTIDVI